MEDKQIFRAFDFSDYDGLVRICLSFDPEENKGLLRVEVVEDTGWTATHELPFSAHDFAE